MQDFIRGIISFINEILIQIYKVIEILYNNSLDNRLFLNQQAFLDFMNKDVFTSTSWIGINITWNELIVYFGTIFIAIFFILLFVKFILKIVSVFRV